MTGVTFNVAPLGKEELGALEIFLGSNILPKLYGLILESDFLCAFVLSRKQGKRHSSRMPQIQMARLVLGFRFFPHVKDFMTRWIGTALFKRFAAFNAFYEIVRPTLLM